MKYLLDECLSGRVGESLRAAGYDVKHAADLKLLGKVDEHVLLAAKRDGGKSATRARDVMRQKVSGLI